MGPLTISSSQRSGHSFFVGWPDVVEAGSFQCGGHALGEVIIMGWTVSGFSFCVSFKGWLVHNHWVRPGFCGCG